MSAYSNLVTLSIVSPASTIRVGAAQIIKVITSGSGAKIQFFDNGASLNEKVVSETPAAISTASQMLISLTITGGTIYINANLISSIVTDGSTGSLVSYLNPFSSTREVFNASETPAAIQTAVAAIVGSGGGVPVTGLTAHAGGGQGSATQLSFGFNEVTTVATAGDSVKLQAAQAGAVTTVLNDGANAMDVFPATGDTINDGSANVAISLAPGNEVVFTAINSTNWETSGQTIRTGSIVVTGTTDSTSKDTGSIVTEGGIGAEKAIFAGTTINAGTALTVGTDQTFAKEVNHSISVPASTTTNADGGNISVSSGAGDGSGNGGSVTINSGAGGATGQSGSLVLRTLAGGGTSGDSGNASLSTGNSTVGGTGDVNLTTGNTASGVAGDINITPGTHTSTTVSPMISLNKAVVRKPFSSTTASGGTITGVELLGGLIAATGATGNWNLPTAAEITTAIGATPAGTHFEFVFNAQAMTATNVATLLVGAGMTVMSAPAITGGGALTISQNTQSVGVFKIIFDTTTTCKISRIA